MGLLHLVDGGGLAGLQVIDQGLALCFHIEYLRQLADAFVEGVDAVFGGAGAVRAGQVVLALAIRRHEVGGDLQVVELLAGGNHAFLADVPFELGDHDAGLFLDHRFEARVVVGQAGHPVIDGLELRQHRVEPYRGAFQSVAQTQRIQHFGAGLADGDGRGGGLRKLQCVATVVHLQRVGGGLCGHG